MNKKIISDFQKMIDVNTPIIYINDYDFVRIDEIISEIVGKSKVFEWNPATGTTNFKTKECQGLGDQDTLEFFLKEKYTVESNLKEKFLVLKDIQDYIEEPSIKTLLQLIAQRKLYDREYNTTVIIVSSVLKVPQELEKYVSYLDIPFPEEEEINQLIDEHIEVNCYDNFKDEDRKKLMPSLKGMTSFEIDRMLDMAMSSNGSLSAEDTEMILQQKKSMVKKSGLLELIDTPASLDKIGGMNALKDYLKNKSGLLQTCQRLRILVCQYLKVSLLLVCLAVENHFVQRHQQHCLTHLC